MCNDYYKAVAFELERLNVRDIDDTEYAAMRVAERAGHPAWAIARAIAKSRKPTHPAAR